jgi:hypothetical protein
VLYFHNDKLHRVNGPARIQVLYQPRHIVQLEWHSFGRLQRSLDISMKCRTHKLNKLVSLHVPESLKARHRWPENVVINTTLNYFEMERKLAVHHDETEKYISYDVSRFNAAVRRAAEAEATLDESSKNADESNDTVDPLESTFFASAYDAIDEAERQMRRRRRARQQNPPKKKRLVKRCDSDDSIDTLNTAESPIDGHTAL